MTRPIPAHEISAGVVDLTRQVSDKATSRLMREIAPDVRKIADLIRKGDFQSAKSHTMALNFADHMKLIEKYLRAWSRQSALLGAGAVDSPKTSIWATGAPFPWEVDTGAVRQVQNGVVSLLDGTKRKLEERITRASRFQKRRWFRKADPIDPNKLATDINRYLRGEIRRVVDVSANLTGTRLSAYGMFHEARVRGISKYRLDATIDDRTTDICRSLDGKTFSVEESYTKTQTVLGATDPEQIKALAPFPTYEQIDGKSSADLQKMGFTTPPFHFLCRTVVTLIESQTVEDPVDFQGYDVFDQSQAEAYQKENSNLVAALAIPGVKNLDTLATLVPEADAFPKLKAVMDYSKGLHQILNSSLRKNLENFPTERNILVNLDEIMTKASTPTDMVVLRRVSLDLASKFEIGKVFQDDAFVSTTLSKKFMDTIVKDGPSAILEIKVPKGAPGLMMEDVTAFKTEYEVLLDRGSQFRIVGTDKMIVNGEEVPVFRAVWQGVGAKLSAEKIGLETLPAAESVVKSMPPRTELYTWVSGDVREASFPG